MAESIRLSDIPDSESVRLSEVKEPLKLVDVPGEERSLADKFLGVYWAPAEASLTIGSSLASLIPRGIAGIAYGAAGEDPGEGVETVQSYWQYEPRYPEGEKLAGLINWPFEKWSEYVSKPVGEAAQDYVLGVDPEEDIPDLGMRTAFKAEMERSGGAGGAAAVETGFELAPYVLGPKVFKAAKEKITSSERLAQMAETVKEVVSPIATGSSKARAEVKGYSNSIRESAAMRNHEMAVIDKKFDRKQQEKMGDALAQEEVAFVKGKEAEGGIDSLSMTEKTAVIDLVNKHKPIAEKAVELGIIPVSKDFYFPRKAILGLGLESAKRIYSSRQVKTATVHAKKRKYETIEETEAAIIEKLGADTSINRNIKVLPLVTAELERAIAGKLLIKSIREYGTKIGVETVKYGAEDSAFFTLPHPAFREYRPKPIRRAEGDVGPQGGQWKILKDGDGNVVFFPEQIKIHRDFEGPMKAALENASGPTYQALMTLKSKSMSVIMFSPLMHGQVIWGKVLPFQIGRTLTLKNYRDGHKIQNIRGTSKGQQAKWKENETWVRDESGGEFSGSNQAMRQALKDGYVPIESMGWMQRMTDVIGTPTLEAGRSVTSRVVGAIAKPLGKQKQAMRGVDWLGGMWHDKLLWEQIRAMGYGLWFNLRNQGIKKGVPPDIAGKVAAHMANRFTGTIPFEDMSAGVRNVANIMLFSKSFTGTNLGLYKDALKGLPKAVQSQIIESGGGIAGVKWANSKIRRAASAALVKDIAFVYILNSMLQNAVQMWKADNKEEAFDDIIDQYSNNSDRYKELADNPLAAIYNLDELAAGSINDPGKESRVFIGTKPDGTAIYIRSPLGKVGEDLLKAATAPIELGWNKLSPTVGFIAGVALNDKSKQRDFDIDVYDPEGNTLENFRDIFYYFLESHTPSDYAEAIVGAARGDKDATKKWAAYLQPLGISFSKGYPGGPLGGTLRKKEEAYMRSIRRHGPEIRRLIENEDFDAAMQETLKAGMRPQEIAAFLRSKAAPHITEKQISDFLQIADEAETMRLMHQFEYFYGTDPSTE